MPRPTVIDARQLFPLLHEPHEVTPATERLAGYCARIVEAATGAARWGRWYPTALLCRRRPNRKPCGGHLQVQLCEVPEEVRWKCSNCLDGGLVTTWRGSLWDLSDVDEGVGELLHVFLEPGVFKAVAELGWLEEPAYRAVRAAASLGDEVLVQAPREAMELLHEGLVTAWNHAGRRRDQKVLEQACGALDDVL